MTSYRSFGEQSRHYFVRPHERMPEAPVDHPAAWRGPDMAAHPERWLVALTEAEISELAAAAQPLQDQGVPLSEVTAETFVLPTLSGKIAAWKETLRTGRGFIAVRGLPVLDWGDEVSARVFWGIGHHLGIPGAQNPQDELLGHITDYGEEGDNPMVRRYRTSGNIDFHCDAADVVGLLCLRKAKRGGQSRIASSVTLFNELMARRPDLAPRLFQPLKLDKRGEEKPGTAPTADITPSTYTGGVLRTFWHSDYFRSSPRHDGVADYTHEEMALLDLYDALAASPDIHLDMWLEPGDMQFISNHTIVHARTAYEDYADPNEKRHLLRLWLSFD